MKQMATATWVPDKRKRLHAAKLGHGTPVWKQQVVVASLILLDGFLAALGWSMAYMLQSIWGPGDTFRGHPWRCGASVAVWIGIRLVLETDPWYGWDSVEKLHWHTYSMFATGTILMGFVLAFQIGDVLLLLVSAWLLWVSYSWVRRDRTSLSGAV